MEPRRLAKYELLEEVGRGGMAVVYRGRDTSLGRDVAVKILHSHLAGDPESRARLEREAQAVAKLRHDNILEIFDYSGPTSTESYIVTEFIHGQTLKELVSRRPFGFPELAAMAASEIARALEHAHGLGVLHRDIKPENVMVRTDGVLKLMDFGIAQIVDKERMTVTGQLLGSPAYMAPEHVEGRPLDFRTDVFALGILTYQLATGQLPFRGKNPHEVLKRIAECQYTPAEQVNPRMSARLAKIIGRALRRDPGERYANVAAMRAELVEDLAEVGVTDARAELAAYFKEPEEWERRFTRRLVDALVEGGRRHQAAGRKSRALEMWGRGLQLEESNAELRGLVDGIAAGARTRRRLGWGAGVGFGSLALLGLYVLVSGTYPVRSPDGGVRFFSLPSTRPASPSPSGPVSPVGPVPTAGAAGGQPGVRPEHRGTSPRAQLRPHVAVAVPPSAPAAPLAPSIARRTVALVPSPKAVRVLLDGNDLGEFGPSLSHIDLGPGEHTIEFRSPACYPKRITIPATESPERITARLKWKPAALLVEADPPDAQVLIDGTIPARAGQTIPIPIAELSLDGRRSVTIRALANGRRSLEKTATLRANETLTVRLELPRGGEPL